MRRVGVVRRDYTPRKEREEEHKNQVRGENTVEKHGKTER
jgi:hypothetical protein